MSSGETYRQKRRAVLFFFSLSLSLSLGAAGRETG